MPINNSLPALSTAAKGGLPVADQGPGGKIGRGGVEGGQTFEQHVGQQGERRYSLPAPPAGSEAGGRGVLHGGDAGGDDRGQGVGLEMGKIMSFGLDSQHDPLGPLGFASTPPMLAEIGSPLQGTPSPEAAKGRGGRFHQRRGSGESEALSVAGMMMAASHGGGGVTGSCNEVEQTLAGQELRHSLNQLLQTLSVLSALLSAWGLTIYASPAADCRCFGEGAKLAAIVLEWMTLGLFFLTVCCSVAVMIDVEGVPSVILGFHLENRNNQMIHR